MKALRNIAACVTVSVLFTSCADLLNVNPDDVLLEENYPSTITELYSGYMGIAATVQSVADKVSFIEGLRGDFLEPTSNANSDMVELYNYDNISATNDLANPVGYYNIILNANDYIGHASDFYLENPTSIDEETFLALVGGAIRYKTWAYLMLAKIYGEAVWIDDPLIEYEDISQFPVYDFDQLINSCIDLMETGIEVEGTQVDGKSIVKWSSVLFPNTTSDYSWDCIDPAPEMLLGELYMFAGNYQLAFDYLFALLRTGSEDNRLEVTKSEYNQEWIKLFQGFVRKEAVFALTYEYNYNQTNHLIDYYSNSSPNKYYLCPTQVAMDRFNQQKQSNGNIGDLYRGEDKTFKQIDNEWVVYKFLSAHLSSDKIYRNDVIVNLYRASELHLLLAEALAQLGRFDEAVVFLDGGLENYYDNTTGSFATPFESYPSTLYASGGDGTTQGVRTRVALAKVADQVVKTPALNPDDDKAFFDSLLVEEVCMELAGEGKAYYTMLRIAKRWNDPSILADRVSAKYPGGLQEAIRNKLMDQANWFIDFELQEN